MPIKNFKTKEEFRTYVAALDKEKIRAWKTADWNNLYSGVSQLLYRYPDNLVLRDITSVTNAAIRKINLIFGKNNPEKRKEHHHNFFIDNIESLTKLYSNYKMEPPQSAHIKAIAREYASYILRRDPELKNDILCMDII